MTKEPTYQNFKIITVGIFKDPALCFRISIQLESTYVSTNKEIVVMKLTRDLSMNHSEIYIEPQDGYQSLVKESILNRDKLIRTALNAMFDEAAKYSAILEKIES